MAEIYPFKGIKYNLKNEDLANVITPPYDVITQEEQEIFYNKHSYNFIRLILGKEFISDNEKDNRYIRAANYLHEWLDKKILIQEEKEVIYIYKQAYYFESSYKIRTGFVALIKLEDYEKGIICPHEETLSKPKVDRLILIRTCRANLSKIFALYQDSQFVINQILEEESNKTSPIIDTIDYQGIRHMVWIISDRVVQTKIIKEMAPKQIFIADGHHRYESALNFRNEMRGITGDYSDRYSYNFVMMNFINMEDPNLTILPAHRLIRGLKIDVNHLEKKIDYYFNIKSLNFSSHKATDWQKDSLFYEMKMRNSTEHVFGMYIPSVFKYYLLVLKDHKIMNKLIPDKKKSLVWKKIDVVILHYLLIEYILELKTKILEHEHNILYIKDKEEAFKLLEEGKYQLGLFINPTKIEEIKAIAINQEKMPGKATYFYPKPASGLIIYKF